MQTVSYKTAQELGINEVTRQGLVQLARDLADGTVPPERFNMAHSCGTACCIGGHLAERGAISHKVIWRKAYPSMYSLFFPYGSAIQTTEPHKGSAAIINFLMGASDPWAGVA